MFRFAIRKLGPKVIPALCKEDQETADYLASPMNMKGSSCQIQNFEHPLISAFPVYGKHKGHYV